MNTKLVLVEFSVLILWALVFVYCTAYHLPVNGALSGAFCSFVGAAAVRNTWGGGGQA
jgi:hypothetical protein